MRILITLMLGLLLVAAPAAAQEPRSEEQKTFYTLGLLLSQGIQSFALTEAELEMVKAGLTDGVLKRPFKTEPQAYAPKVAELQKTRLAASGAAERKAGETFLAKAAGEKGAQRTASGLVMTTLKAGTGASPKATDKVKVHYHGTLTDGSVFDSSVQRGEPVTFTLNQVIRCWSEGVPLMKVGGKSRLVCPADLAYGDRGAPPRIKPGATLVFEVELLEIVK
jgi:FKBP-type peptidyl-prolyl cis-trans isomerase FkpA/FKBP-type peptidyl-prolyl cis-trans isomerase FklB